MTRKKRRFAVVSAPVVAVERLPLVEPAFADPSFEAFFELAAVGVTQVDARTGRFLRVNRCFAELTGYRCDELTQLTVFDLTHPDALPENVLMFERMAGGELTSFSLEKRLRRKDGRWLWVIVTAAVARDAGEPLRAVAVVQDVTERKRREVHGALIAEVQDAFSRAADVDEMMRVVGAALCRALEVDRVDFIALDENEGAIALHTHPAGENGLTLSGGGDGSPEVLFSAPILSELHSGKTVTIGDVRADARLNPENVRGTCAALAHLPHLSGERCRFVLSVQRLRPHVWRRHEIEVLRDIGDRVWLLLERNRAEGELRESEARLRRAIDIDTVGIVFFHLAGTIIDANDTFLRFTGYSREELRLGLMRWDNVIAPEWLDLVHLSMNELGSRGRTTPYEAEYLCKNAARRPGLSCATLLSDDVGAVFVIDITERKQAEALLARDREQLEQYVLNRTAELDAVNGALRDEILERQRGEAERQALMSQLVAAQEDERRRISRELHDQVGQHVTALLLGLKSPGLVKDTPAAKALLKDMQQLTETIGKQLHDIALDLRPTSLDDLGLVRTLTNFVEDWSARAGVEVDFHTSGLKNRRLPLAIETTLYRIVCEAFNNILKHAKAKRVSLIIERTAKQATAIIEDDGRGFDLETTLRGPPRLGLTGMRERAVLVQGEVNIESEVGHGTTIFVRIPLPSQKETTSHG